MAIIKAGILSNVSGAVAGVVGGTWKGRNYLRARVTPANPNTPAQQTQRSKMSKCVAFAKLILGTVLNVYVDPYQKTMSGFNWFVKNNIALFGSTINYSNIIVVEGKLYPIQITTVERTDDSLDIVYSSANGSNGSATDLIGAVIYNESTGAVVLDIGSVTRTDGELVITNSGTLIDDDSHIYLFAYSMVDGKLVAVSNTSYNNS